MARPNQIIIDSDDNIVEVSKEVNQIQISSSYCNTEVTVDQPVTEIVRVATVGADGTSGIDGTSGTSGSSGVDGDIWFFR
jgi:hypothetical protein